MFIRFFLPLHYTINATKNVCRCEDWTNESFQEDIYVDIRAYGTLLFFRIEIIRNYLKHSDTISQRQKKPWQSMDGME